MPDKPKKSERGRPILRLAGKGTSSRPVRPLSKDTAEGILIDTLSELEEALPEGDQLWGEAVEWRARLRARRARRRRDLTLGGA